MALSVSRLRENVYNLLDQVLATGVPLEIERKGRLLRIVAVEADGHDKLANVIPRPDFIIGDPDDLIHMDWSAEWNPDLP